MAGPDLETRLDEAALSELLESGAGWRRDGSALTRTFTFKGFKGAMAFANRVAEAANAANHHPDIHVEGYKNVRIVLTTHATGGTMHAGGEVAEKSDAADAWSRGPPPSGIPAQPLGCTPAVSSS